jgi:hypothetical protein
MKKLKLQIETLRVEQFEVHSASPVIRGTVQGHASEVACYSEACYSDNGDATCYCGVGPSAPWSYCLDMPGSAHLYWTDCC